MTGAAARDLERDLIRRHCYGDPEAFEEIYGRFEAMVFNLALRMAGDAEAAEDITQDTFLRVLRHLPDFRGRSSLKTWIYKVALNCCRSRLGRRQVRRRRVSSGPPERLERVADPAPGPEADALAQSAEEALRRAIARLPLPYREAVVLRDVQGQSYREIAAVLGVRIGTVRSRIARGRDRLRRILEESS